MMNQADIKMEEAIKKMPLNKFRYNSLFYAIMLFLHWFSLIKKKNLFLYTNSSKKGKTNIYKQLNMFLLLFKKWNWELPFIKQGDPLFKLYIVGALVAFAAIIIILLILFLE